MESVQLAPVLNSDLPTPYAAWTVGSFNESLGANDLIIKYTYTGDFNLDGEVTRADYAVFGGNFDNGASGGNEWAFGDTNGDGLLTHADAANFNTAYLNGTGSAAANDPTQL